MASSLFKAVPFTAAGAFTPEIEGPACDFEGNVYAVSYERKPTIGKVAPDGAGEVFLEMPSGSLANDIRFDRNGTMFVADYTGHNVLRVDLQTRVMTVHAHEPGMHQPNDIAIGATGTIWASDPDWANGTGQVWRVTTAGVVALAAPDMGTTNGIEVSPDGKTLYVNETVQRQIWVFDIQPDESLTGKRLLCSFPDHGLDGMRCDVDGNLYVTRWGKGTVAMIDKHGQILGEVAVLGAKPTNICFGGEDGCTAYVTEAEAGRLVTFRVPRPGLEWQRWRL